MFNRIFLKIKISLIAIILSYPISSQVTVDGIDIPAGGTYVLSEAAGQRDLIIGSLVMGDSSTLVVPASFGSWNVTIFDTEIGTNTKIIARGVNGSNNTAARSKPATAPRCRRGGSRSRYFGRDGLDSSKGQDGGRGVNLVIEMGIGTVESLLIDASGGNGGNSGNGGPGGDAGRSDCTSNCTGGNGGPGGDALQARGGNGGSVTLLYWLNGNRTPDSSSPFPGISILSEGGDVGAIGSPGSGGKGAARRRCRWPYSNRQKQPDGRNGFLRYATAGSDGRISRRWIESRNESFMSMNGGNFNFTD